ncbi:restriction endonuclease subunit S [Campylobacter sp.]|uniref:restriction endonuclease subunit S n=1 Tax=Campylobacter sp. TaxID=205 RepID=UPI00259CF3E5|nr:restriction endonuclease subunit S [Campylobacter sp.]MBQ3167352.1 restriction endonuclease subunit S [Campylobacter sp.]
MNKIPKGWEVKKLGEICEITMGQSPKGENVFENSQSLNGLEFHQGKICFTDKFISKSKFITSDIRKIAEVGSILLCVRAPVGVINLTERKIAIGRGLCALKANNQNNNFLYYYLLGLKQYFESKATGSTFSAITLNIVKNCEIPLPPLSEQKAIVDKLDDSFAKIENAITNLINAKENLKLYKQSVLKSAFNGDLLPNTSPTHWEVKKLGEICEINPKTEILLLNESDEVSFIPMASVEAETNIFTESKSKFSKVKKGYTKFRDNDILFAKITPCMENGKICIVNNLKFGIGFGSTEFHVIRPNKNTLSKYIYYFVSQISFRQMAQIYMTGAVGQRRVPSKILENFEIPLPPLSEQNLIVAEIDRRFAIVDKTLNLIDKNIQNAKNLKQSILKKAFSGELRSEI